MLLKSIVKRTVVGAALGLLVSVVAHSRAVDLVNAEAAAVHRSIPPMTTWGESGRGAFARPCIVYVIAGVLLSALSLTVVPSLKPELEEQRGTAGARTLKLVMWAAIGAALGVIIAVDAHVRAVDLAAYTVATQGLRVPQDMKGAFGEKGRPRLWASVLLYATVSAAAFAVTCVARRKYAQMLYFNTPHKSPVRPPTATAPVRNAGTQRKPRT